MKAPHNVPPGDYEELRLALVMNGGVSLAVWIGGVTHEINRAVRGTDGYGTALEYRALLDLTATTARVDVISGASAGGLNGALLAMALAFNTDLSPLRDVWLKKGGLDRLLRDPFESNPSSLLRGNDRFLDDLRSAFQDLQRSGSLTKSDAVPLDLTLTATLLHGEPSQISDDLGTVIGDVKHRGQLQFSRGGQHRADAFADKDIAGRLALAARASASFPVAFEPTFCPIKDPSDDARFHDMDGIASFKKSRYLLDGGILDNKPLESALAAVFRQRADREVRRVLAYVEPSPGGTAIDRADKADEAPTLAEVAFASLVELPRIESISAQLEDIIEHNRQVRRKRQTRVVLIRELKAEGLQTLATQLFAVYRKRRADSAADYVVETLSSAMAAIPDATTTLGRRRREWLSRVISERPKAPWVPSDFPAVPAAKGQSEFANWTWGLFTLEHVAEVVIDLLRRALIVAPLDESELRQRLKAHYADAFDLLVAIPRRRREERGFWEERAEDLVTVMKSNGDLVGEARAWIDAAMEASSARTEDIGKSARRPAIAGRTVPAGAVPLTSALGWFALALADVIGRAAPDISSAARGAATSGRTSDDRAFASDLQAYVDYVAPQDAREPDAILVRILILEIVLYATGSYRETPDQFVELVQISASGSSAFGGPSTPSEKLAGAQLGNFGAFYKRSWRANDWLFGRMDGADRIVRVLLNPARLARLYPSRSADVEQMLRTIAVPEGGSAETRTFLEQRWTTKAASVRAELSFLDRPELPVPEQLPCAVDAVLGPIHLRMLTEELPEIAGAAEDDRQAGAGPRGAGASFVETARRYVGNSGIAGWQQLPPDKLITLFTTCGIGSERLAGEVGTDLFTSTLTRALAVGANTISGSQAGLGALGRVLQVIRIPLVILNALAQTAITQSRTAAFAFGSALSIGGTISAIELIAPGLLAANVAKLGGIVFIGSVALLIRRRPLLSLGWIALAAAVWLGHRLVN